LLNMENINWCLGKIQKLKKWTTHQKRIVSVTTMTTPGHWTDNLPVKWVASIALTFIGMLVLLPMYDNLRHQAVTIRLLRHQAQIDAFSLRVLTLQENDTISSILFYDNLRKADTKKRMTSSRPSNYHSDAKSTDETSTQLPPPMLATNVPTEEHARRMEATNDGGIKLANLSSVDYVARGGLGHRLARMAAAAWTAKRLKFAMHTYWGHCGDDTEVFQHLFGVQSKESLRHVTDTNQFVRFHNDVDGFHTLERKARENECYCQKEQVHADRDFYKDLRNRFRYKKIVDAFVKKTFAHHVVLGMHIRAGNGEKGNVAKKLEIDNVTDWVKEASQRIIELSKKENWKKPPLLYIVTDTPSLIDLFGSELKGVMPVIDFPQERNADGDGVWFGDAGTEDREDLKCIRAWENNVMDMILLSHADLLIAARMNSFVQTMPMSLVFGRSHKRVRTPTCELNFNATSLICSETYLDWCCNVTSSDIRPTPLQETILVPKKIKLDMSRYEPKERPTKESEIIYALDRSYLPYYWETKAMQEKN
jgi:hypothetical protein